MSGLSVLEQRIIGHLHGRQGAMAAEVADWAQINSGTRNLAGLETMRGLIAARLAPIVDSIETRAPDPVTMLSDRGEEVSVPHGANLLARKRVPAKRRMILTGHMDTVFSPDHPFQSCQILGGNRLNGPGVADMKGGLIVMIEALHALELSGAIPSLGWDVVVNADEEVSSLASASLLREIAHGAQIGMTFESTVTPEGTLASSRRGSGNFIATIIGRPAHAGQAPQNGRNAVVAAADFALRLEQLKRDIPGLLVNVARITGGGPNNIVPDQAALTWNIRPLDFETNRKAQNGIKAAFDAVEATHEVSIRMGGQFARPPKLFDAPHEALFGLVRDTGADLGIRVDWQPSGGVCDGNNIAAENVIVVDTMGVRGGAIHTSDEFLLLDSMSERAALAAITILRIAEGRLDPVLAQVS